MNLRIQIDKPYRGHAKQVAAAVWGLGSQNKGKNLIVVDKDIDIFDDEAIEWAMAQRTNAEMGDIQFFKGTIGESLDPSVPLEQRDPMKYGAGKSARVFIDATVNWELEPQEQYGGKREPPLCTVTLPEIAELVSRRWKEYGIQITGRILGLKNISPDNDKLYLFFLYRDLGFKKSVQRKTCVPSDGGTVGQTWGGRFKNMIFVQREFDPAVTGLAYKK